MDSEAGAIELTLEAHRRSVAASFEVARVLPARARRMVGPFAFFDHFGPVSIPPGTGMDVRPHPHIGLATVTVLFSGDLVHRDSLGSEQVIRPGAINWMTAGAGIVHSERSTPEARATGSDVHGLQLWVALPVEHEDDAPSFSHHAADTLPVIEEPGAVLRLLAGTAYGAASPVPVHSPLFYVDAHLAPGARLALPSEHDERGVYVVDGAVTCDGTALRPHTMGVARRGTDAVVEATEPSHVVFIGGTSLGPRTIWWNFVASSTDRIEEAARRWKKREFPVVPGDETEFIPLDDEPRFPSR